MKTVDLVFHCFHCFGKNEMHMQVQITKHKLYNFGDSAYELKDLLFAFKTGIAQYKDKW